MCVCNICIDVQLPLLAGALEPISLSSPTKLWHFGGYRWMSGLINHLYLHCFSQSLWQGAKPRTPAVFSFLHGCRNLRVSSTLFQTWSTWYSFRIWRRAKPRTLSRSTLEVIFPIYMHVMGFSSQRITLMIQFLSSVISMVAPARCHGPT